MSASTTRHYVRRERDGRVGWIGPIVSAAQADREVAAWRDGGWSADAYPASPELRAHVNAWQREKDREHGRTGR